MRKRRRWLMTPLFSGVVVLIGIGLRGGQADESKRLTAEDVLTQWEPMRDGVEDFQRFWASPKGSSGEATATFRVVGPSFERLWNHYADLCGIVDRYEVKRFLMSGGTSDKGTYVVNDRGSSATKGKRGLSVFLLRTGRYAVTVTIQPDPDGKAMRGSIAVVTL
jgi:hypothetical protein